MGGRGAGGGGGDGALQHLTMGVFLIIRAVPTHQVNLTTKYLGRVLKIDNISLTTSLFSLDLLLLGVFQGDS